jgi:hypothetical protein
MEPHAAEMLARDLDEIVRADQILWDHVESRGGAGGSGVGSNGTGGRGGGGEGGGGPSQMGKSILNSSSMQLQSSDDRAGSGAGAGAGAGQDNSGARVTFLERMKNPLRGMKDLNTIGNNNMSLEEKRQYATSVDAAIAFGKMIRSTLKGEENEGAMIGNDDNGVFDDQPKSFPRYIKPSHSINIGTVKACAASENEGRDEDLRAALTCFFVYMFGDMGIYLSVKLMFICRNCRS